MKIWLAALIAILLGCLAVAACGGKASSSSATYVADDDTAAEPLVDNGDGTATDPVSKLMWQIAPSLAYLVWADAKAFCANLDLAGHRDWRLPDIDALRSLVRGCVQAHSGGACTVTDQCAQYACGNVAGCWGCAPGSVPEAGRCYMPAALAGACEWYWSSSPVADADTNAWGVGFGIAGVNSNNVLFGANVRCVR